MVPGGTGNAAGRVGLPRNDIFLNSFSNTALQLRGAMSSRAENYALARKLL